MKYILRKVEENEEKLGKYEHGGVRGLESSLRHIYERLKILIDTIDDNIDSKHISYNIKNFSLPYKLTHNDIDILLKNFMVKNDMSDAVKSMFI
jgi:hypothetical protein